MQRLDPAGNYSDDEVRDALRFKTGVRELTYRFERLDSTNKLIGPLSSVLSCSVANNMLADIKRSAKFSLLDDGAINYLKDRIKPWARLAMPTGPSSYVGAGAAVWRNLIGTPRPTVYPSGWAIGSAAQSFPGDDWVAAVTAATAPYFFTDTAVDAIPAGTTLTFSVEVLIDSPSPAYSFIRISPHTRAANGYLTSGPSSVFPIVPGQPQRYSVTYTTTAAIVANDLDMAIGLNDASGGSFLTPGAGFAWRVRRPSIVLGAVDPGFFFDGDTPTTPYPDGFAYSWEGAAGNSASLAKAKVEVPDSRPGYVEWPQGVFLLSTPKRTLVDGAYIGRDVEGYDQLQVLADNKVATRYTVPAASVYTTILGTIANAANITANITPSALTVPTTMEWEPGTTYLRIINDLLAAINYESAWFDENGLAIYRPYVTPANRSAEFDYAADAQSVIAGDIGQTLDLFGVPNQWVVVKSEPDLPPLSSTYTNTSTSSPTSTVSRGRTIVDFSTETDAADQATLDGIAQRRAFDASQVYEVVEFDTAAMPFHSNSDVYTVGVTDLGITGIKYTETEWSLDLIAGGTMNHKVRRVVNV